VLSLFLNLTELSWIRNFNLVTRARFFATKFFRPPTGIAASRAMVSFAT
jgi:hypothetical protein